MKLFRCIIDDGENVYKKVLASRNKKTLLEENKGVGEFVSIKDDTEFYNEVSIDYLEETLQKGGFGEGERALITALLREHKSKNLPDFN